MHIQQLLNENVCDILDYISSNCETNKEVCAQYLATIMTLRDMESKLTDDDALMRNTYIDYLYGDVGTSIKAINLFYNRIQQNPRARRLYEQYLKQFRDDGYGHVVMQNRITSLTPYFAKRKQARINYHEETILNNVSRVQDKLAKELKAQYDLSDGDKIRNDQTPR